MCFCRVETCFRRTMDGPKIHAAKLAARSRKQHETTIKQNRRPPTTKNNSPIHHSTLRYNNNNTTNTTKMSYEERDEDGGEGEEEIPQQVAELAQASVPSALRGIRACKRCGLLKTLDQFINEGCENCPFLEMVRGVMWYIYIYIYMMCVCFYYIVGAEGGETVFFEVAEEDSSFVFCFTMPTLTMDCLLCLLKTIISIHKQWNNQNNPIFDTFRSTITNDATCAPRRFLKDKPPSWTHGKVGWQNGFVSTTIFREFMPFRWRVNLIEIRKRIWKTVATDGAVSRRYSSILDSIRFDSIRLTRFVKSMAGYIVTELLGRLSLALGNHTVVLSSRWKA